MNKKILLLVSGGGVAFMVLLAMVIVVVNPQQRLAGVEDDARSPESDPTEMSDVNGLNWSIIETVVDAQERLIVARRLDEPGRGVGYDFVRLYADGRRDTSFISGNGLEQNEDTNVFDNPIITDIDVQDDGKVLVAGGFIGYQGESVKDLIRLNVDGRRDKAFDIQDGFNGLIRVVNVQPDGKVLVGGDFTEYQGQSANHLIRLHPDGRRDGSFDIGTGFDAPVTLITIQDDSKILVAGGRSDIREYNTTSVSQLVRLYPDGQLDQSFDVGEGARIIESDGSVRIGGIWTIDIQDDGRILVGGLFTNFQGEQRQGMVRLDSRGMLDDSFRIEGAFEDDEDLNYTVSKSLIQEDGSILLAGLFDESLDKLNVLMRVYSDGSRDESFGIEYQSEIDGTIRDMHQYDSERILIQGSMNLYQGQSVPNLARIYTMDARLDNSFVWEMDSIEE